MLWRAGLLLNPLDTDPPDKHGLPSAGGRFPKLGHLPALALDMPGLFDWMTERYGPLVWLDRGFGSQVLQVAGEDGFALLKNRDTDSSALHDAAPTFLGRSMIVLDGADHRRARGASAHAFTPAGLDRARVGQLIADVVEERVRSWPQRPRLAIAREARELALSIIFRMIGIDASDIPLWRHQFEELALSAINIPLDFPGSPMRRGRNAQIWLDQRMTAIISRVRRDRDRESVVGAMAHGEDECAEGLSDRELIDNLKLIVLAGHETTASVIAWAMLHLAQQPDDWERLCDEAATLGGVPAKPDDLTRAPFAEGVFREALRLYPPVSSTIRTVRRELTFGNHRVPAGVYVACNIHELSRNPERYPEPNELRPTRWMGLNRRPSQLELCQFGGGPHFCLGYHVAMLEGVAVLIGAALALARRGKRLAPAGPMPKPRYLPVVHPPRGSYVRIVSRS